MKIAWVHYFSFVILTCSLASTQQPSASPSETLAYEDGRIKNNVYANECFGFSFAIPDGWEMNSQLVGADGKARFIFQWQLYLLELDHREHEGGSNFSSEVTLKARLATASKMTAEEFVSNVVHEQVDATNESVRWKLVRDTYSVEYGGRRFSRADYKETEKVSGTPTLLYFALVYTKFRGNFIGATFMARSPELLDRSAKILGNISFREDVRNPKCVVSGSYSYPPGFVFPDPGTPPSKSGQLLPGEVSEAVAKTLLFWRVAPSYPEEAKRNHIQGKVELKVLIDAGGLVKEVTLVSGPKELAPPSIDAVKQWKYKPYLLNGQPVAMETTVTLSFEWADE